MKVLSLKTALQATVPVALSPSKKRAKGISLKKMFIEQIRDGVSIEGKKVYKTVEARIHKGVFAKLKEGDFVDFFYMSKRSDNVICQISNDAKRGEGEPVFACSQGRSTQRGHLPLRIHSWIQRKGKNFRCSCFPTTCLIWKSPF